MSTLFDTATAAPSAGARPVQREIISQAEFARRVERSRQAVNEAIAKDRLPATVRQGKKLVWPDAWHAWQDLRDPQQDHAVTTEARSAPAPSPASSDGKRTAGEELDAVVQSRAKDGEEPDSLRVARTEQAKIDAEIARLKLMREQDRLRDRGEVEREMAAAGVAVVQEIRGLEAHAEELARIGDPQEMRRRLKALGVELRTGIAEALGRLAREGEGEENGHALDS
jgi:hypothetical protein